MLSRRTASLVLAASFGGVGGAGCLQFDVQSLPNQAPEPKVTVDPAGPVTGGTLVTLDARGSTDSDAQDQARLIFRWQQIAGDPVAFDTLSAPEAHFPAPRKPQTLLFFVHVSDGIAEVTSAQVKVEVVNHPPAAEVKVTPEGAVTGGTLVTLDASATTDADPGDTEALVFRWEQVAGDTVPLTTYTQPLAQFEAPRKPQTLIFFLHASDGVSDVPAQVTVPISSRTAPSASAGPDMLVSLEQRVLLDASGSDDEDNDPLAFEWNQIEGPEVQLEGRHNVRASFTAPGTAARLGFRVTVSDGSNEASDDALVEVKAIPEARIKMGIGGDTPVLRESGATVAVGDGDTVVLDGGGSRGPPGGGELAYAWTLPAELLLANAGLDAQLDEALITFKAPTQAAALVIKLRVTAQDVTGATVESPETRLTLIVNPRPIARPGPPRETLNRTPVRLDGTSSEGAATWEWKVAAAPPGGECCVGDAAGCPTGLAPPQPELRKCVSGADTPNPIFTPYARGDYTVQLVVANSAGVRSLPGFALVTALNNAPRANAGPDVSTPNGTSVELRAGFRDPDGDLIDPLDVPGTAARYEVSALPAGATFDLDDDPLDGMLFHFTPHGKGTFFLALVVNDGLADSDPDGLVVSSTNVAPVAAPMTPVVGRNRAAIQLQPGNSRDPDGDSITHLWTVLDKPAGATATLSDPTAAAPTLTPDGKGTYKVQLQVADMDEVSAPAEVSVDAQNNPPIADAGANVADFTQTAIVLDGGLSADPDGDAIASWSWRKAAGPSLASFTGTSTPTPEARFSATGTYQFGLTVGDAESTSTESLVTVVVTRLNRPPIANAGADQTASPGATVTLHGSAVDPEGDAIQSYLWTRESSQAGLPDQLIGTDPVFAAPQSFDTLDYDNNKIVWKLEATDAFGAVSAADRVSVFLAPDERTFVFVSTAGADTESCGGAANPCKSIVQGIDRAAAPARLATGRNVLVTAGTYDQEPVRTVIVPTGVKVLGGWDPTTFKRDPKLYPSILKWPGLYPPEVADGRDNDCDARVDETDVPASTEICNYLDDDGDGYIDNGLTGCTTTDPDLFEPNDTAAQATAVQFGRRYEGMSHIGSEDWYKFTLPVDVPPDPDGAGPLPAPLTLKVQFYITALLNTSTSVSHSIDIYKKTSSGSLSLIFTASCAGNCVSPGIFSANNLGKGEYYVRLWGPSPTGAALQKYYLDAWMEAAARPYCAYLATLMVPAKATAPVEEEVPVIEGLRVFGPTVPIPNYGDSESKVVYCNGCAMRLRDNELYGNASEANIGSVTVRLDNPQELNPVAGPTDYAIIIERNFIRAGIGNTNKAIVFNKATDFAVRNNTVAADAYRTGVSTEFRLLDFTQDLEGSRRGHLHGNTFRLDLPKVVSSYCQVVQLERFGELHFFNNVFDVRSDCGQTTGGLSNNMAISQDIGGTTRKLAFVNNLFLSKPDNANKSIGFNMSACGPAAVFRDNFFSGWDTVINLNNCATHPLVQWNAFSGNDLVSSSPSLTEAQLAADADGKVGNRTADNKYNFVAACTYDADGTGGAGSPCLDKGSIGATVPDTTTMVQTATSVNAHFGKDALGQVRPKDLSSVTNATGGDGTDIGPVERQQ